MNDTLALDPNMLAFAAVGALAAYFFKSLQSPARRQEQLMWMVLAAGGAYALRQFEGRAAAQSHQGESQAAIAEQVRTLFDRSKRADTRLDEHDEEVSELRAEVRVVTSSVSDLVKRIDKVLDVQTSHRSRR